MSTRPLIQAAITILGSEAKLGLACGVSQGAIWKAKRAGRVSGELAVAIEKATKGSVPRWRLRPDLWDRPLNAAPDAPTAQPTAQPTAAEPEAA